MQLVRDVMAYRVYPKDLVTLSDIAYFRYMSADQVQRLHYPNAKNYRTATNRLTQLADVYDHNTGKLITSRYLSFTYFFDPITQAKGGRPQRVFFISPQNTENIRDVYTKLGKSIDFKHIYGDIKTTKRSKSTWAPAHIKHELAITDYGMAHREGAKSDALTRLFWERTSPVTKDISKTYRVRKTDPQTQRVRSFKVNFNPDSIDCIEGELEDEQIRLYLSIVEVDRGTEDAEKQFLPKIYAFDEFIDARHTQELLDYYIQAHHLTASHPYLTNRRAYRVTVRFRTITIDTHRRNELIRLVAHRSRYPQAYHLTTFTDLDRWDTFYRHAVWYAAQDYQPIKQREKQETRSMRQHALTTWVGEQIENHMQRVPYFYRSS